MPLQRGIRNPDLFLSRPDTRQTSEEVDIVNTIENLDASQIAFTPAGGLSSSTVQAALEELDSDLASATVPYSSVNSVTTARLLGRTTAGTGAAELISVGSGLSLSAGTLSATGYVAKTANYTLTANDYTVECTANSFTLTLPTAVGASGQVYNLKNTGTGVITVATTSSQTIDGNASGAITLAQYDNLTVQSNNANWIIL